jgi:hypothetical protein
MNVILEQITERKRTLLDQAEAQRLELAVLYTSLERPARVATQVNTFFRNPFVLAGAGICALKMPWRRLFRVSGWAWKGWKWFRVIKTLRRFAP